jgi:regulator of replication initiation timing
MKTKYLPQLMLIILVLFLQGKTFAQMGINASGTPPANNAMLDISSTTKGLLIPRMTTTERLALSTIQGLTVYDITTNGYWYFDNSSWVNLATISSASPWLTSGSHIYNSNLGNVGIGTAVPIAPLNIYVGTSSGIAKTQYQTVNTGKLPTDGFFTGIANFGLNAFVINNENAGLIFGTNGNSNMKIDEIGNVGINTTSPLAALHVQHKSVLFNGLSNFFGVPILPTPVSGAGTRTFWYASKAAFRTGGVSNSSIFGFPDPDTTNFHNWDKDSIGVFSFAAGFNTKAKGDFSVAMGNQSYALGNSSIALGNGNVAKGNFSIASGFNNLTSGETSTAFGYYSKASGDYSFAAGQFATSSGNTSTAFGGNSLASGNYSTSFGSSTTASGINSTAMGRNANTNNHTNSFCIGGTSGALVTSNTAPNQMMMRFDNYTFYVAGTNNYAYIIPSSNGWAYTSDRNRKENFEELNGESVLRKISKIPFYSWNFKDKEVKQYRHYGIMAQDFHDNFGKDNLGVIGNDTTVSALDLLGVAYSGIKALEKRTEELLTKNEALKLKNEKLEAQVQFQNQKFSDEIAELRTIILPKKRKYALNKNKVYSEGKSNFLSIK